jgi:hypothetical protein
LVHVTVVPRATVIGVGLKATFRIVALTCLAAGVGVAVGSGLAGADGVAVRVLSAAAVT